MLKIIISTMIFINCAISASYKMEVVPKEPIAGETFSIIFKIDSKEGSNPVINFNPSGLEILSKEETGTSTTTTYINGNLTVNRTISVSYEAVSSRPGYAYLRDINIDIGTENLKGKVEKIRILKELKKERDVFVRAEVNKEEAFVNESIIVRYYLYSRLRVLSMDIKKFPTLDKFLKRFHQESQGVERVQLNNGIYERRIIYSAQLFSNKIGKVKIDPISISVAYADRRRGGNPFSNFGFGGMRSKKRSLQSKRVEVDIKALPNDTPSGFTGLVGKHKVDFKINKSKFLVNEPIEINLSFKGMGALELYEEPKFFNTSMVEEFDSTSDFVINKDFSAEKSFKITYLAREAGTIESQEKKLVFFDPDSLKFIEKIIKIPAIIIAGTSISSNQSKVINNKNDFQKNENVVKIEKNQINLDPIYRFKNTLVYNKITISLFILFIFLVFVTFRIYKVLIKSKRTVNLDLYQKALKFGVSYSTFYELVNELGKGTSLKEIIIHSSLKEQDQKYLIELLNKFNKAFEKDEKIKVKLSKKIVNNIRMARFER